MSLHGVHPYATTPERSGATVTRWLTGWIASLLFGVTPTDLTTHLVVFAVPGSVALLASYLPARIDPIVALRARVTSSSNRQRYRFWPR